MLKPSHARLLRRAIKKAGSQKALADALGYSHRSIISNWLQRGLPAGCRGALLEYLK